MSQDVIEFELEEEALCEALARLGAEEVVVTMGEDILFRYPRDADVSQILSQVRSTLSILSDADPFLELRFQDRAIFVLRVDDYIAVASGRFQEGSAEDARLLLELLVNRAREELEHY